MTPRERAEALAERCTWCGVSLCDHCHRDVAAAIESALAGQAAGEAERTARARREAYEDAAQIADRYGHAHIADAIRARATSPAPEPVAAERMPMPVRVALWDAVNAYVATCGGDASAHVYGNTPRMDAVVAVERVVADALAAARKGGE